MTKAKKGVLIVPDRFAVMAVDPGTTTGVAFGLLNPERNVDGTLRGLLTRGVKKKAVWADEVTGEPEAQAWKIANTWSAFMFRCNVELSLSVDDIHLVIEAFQLRTGQADLSPVMVTYGVMTLLYKSFEQNKRERLNAPSVDDGFWPLGEPEFQEPSGAKGFATSDRMRDWGVWQVGSPHMRDAVRHLCLKASNVLDGRG